MRLPVHCNVGLEVSDSAAGASGYLPADLPPAGLSVGKAWSHPGYTTDPRRMVAAVARARGLITRKTASSVSLGGEDAQPGVCVSVHVAAMSTKWELAGYSVKSSDIRAEISARGPVVASVPVTDALLAHVSDHLSSNSPAPPLPSPDAPVHGNVIVALLGWKDRHWVVALPWGKYPEFNWDGTVLWPWGSELDACGMAQMSDVSATPADAHIRVTVLPRDWNPLTTQPLPQVAPTRIGTAVGKSKPLRHTKRRASAAHKPKFSLRQWMSSDENAGVAMQCVVTLSIIVVAILTLVAIRRQHKLA